MSNSPTLLTGATGFVGSAVARTLEARGHSLRLLVRPASDRRNLAGLAGEPVEGDLTDPGSLQRAMAGCGALVHVAADYRIWVPDPEAMIRANVGGTFELMRAAQQAGVSRIVYCSSVAALGLTKDGSSADETTPVTEDVIVGVYKKSKYRAEQAVLDMVRQHGLPAVIVNPSTPVGPRDIKPTPTGKMIADAASGRMPAYIDTGLNIVHVDDVAEGHALALERGTVGEKYILGGENLFLRDLLALIASVTGRRAPRIKLRHDLLWPLAIGMEAASKLTGERADGQPRPSQDGAQAHVLFFGEGRGGTGLPAPACPGCRGRCGGVVSGERNGAPLTALAAVSLLIWAYLLGFHGRFWQMGPVLRPSSAPASGEVVVVVPARDEAASIAFAVRSLLAQKYPGDFRVIVVDDQSADGTGAIVRAIADPRLVLLEGRPRPPGWSGKLWAVSQGVAAAGDAAFILLTDADIVHDERHLATLVAKAEDGGLDLVSEMVALACESWAERALVPAFVFFFQLLYPFASVNDPRRRTAAAAGGSILVRSGALARVGGIAAIREMLIDDVALAAKVKRDGSIWLGHSVLARSIRPYPHAADIWRMVARTAYVQLRRSPVLLALCLVGMVLTWIVPPVAALFGATLARGMGLLAWLGAAASYLPTLRRFGRSPLWSAILPLIALFYMAATVGSALQHYRGRGVVWKSRAYRSADA